MLQAKVSRRGQVDNESRTAWAGLLLTATLKRHVFPVAELFQMHEVAEGESIINFWTLLEEIDNKECTSSHSIWLTIDCLSNDDLYVIKCEFQNEDGKHIQGKCNAREMDKRGSTGLALFSRELICL